MPCLRVVQQVSCERSCVYIFSISFSDSFVQSFKQKPCRKFTLRAIMTLFMLTESFPGSNHITVGTGFHRYPLPLKTSEKNAITGWYLLVIVERFSSRRQRWPSIMTHPVLKVLFYPQAFQHSQYQSLCTIRGIERTRLSPECGICTHGFVPWAKKQPYFRQIRLFGIKFSCRKKETRYIKNASHLSAPSKG